MSNRLLRLRMVEGGRSNIFHVEWNCLPCVGDFGCFWCATCATKTKIKHQKHKLCLGNVVTTKRYWTGTDVENRENIKNMKNILEKRKIPRVTRKRLKIVCFVFCVSTLRPPLIVVGLWLIHHHHHHHHEWTMKHLHSSTAPIWYGEVDDMV